MAKSKSRRSLSTRKYRRKSSKKSKRSKSKSKVRIILGKGSLKGYHVKDSPLKRRRILSRMLKSRKSTYSQVIKRLNVLAIYNKNRSPKLTSKVRTDIKYIQNKFKSYSKTYSKKMKRTLKSRLRTKRRVRSRTKVSNRKSKKSSRRTKRRSRK